MGLAALASVVVLVGIGASLVVQTGINASLAAPLGSPVFAAFTSMFVGTTILVTANTLSGAPSLHKWAFTDAARGRSVQWRLLIRSGGLMGAVIVAVGIYVSPHIGFGLFYVSLVFGQVTVSVVVDHYALLAVPRNPFTRPKALVIAIAIAALAMLMAEQEYGESATERLSSVGFALLSFLAGVLQPTQACLNTQLSNRSVRDSASRVSSVSVYTHHLSSLGRNAAGVFLTRACAPCCSRFRLLQSRCFCSLWCCCPSSTAEATPSSSCTNLRAGCFLALCLALLSSSPEYISFPIWASLASRLRSPRDRCSCPSSWTTTVSLASRSSLPRHCALPVSPVFFSRINR
eukprot:m.681481 g.681481  ORF g.681481 m.681481 type:complete len:347 (+) comp58599_c0_seq9:2334-3374(+)